MGYFHGPATGSRTPQMRTALAAYQRDHRLPVTGALDARTARRLQIQAQ
jgi:peptidoglycan hydrolase-like protein with peptidoglycan-binding domain